MRGAFTNGSGGKIEKAMLEYIATCVLHTVPLEVKLQDTLAHGSKDEIEKCMKVRRR